jgi:adenylate cyclase
MGDVFGTTVNLASRLTAIAPADQILVGPAVAEALTGNSAYELRRLDPRILRGLGRVEPSVLSRAPAT